MNKIAAIEIDNMRNTINKTETDNPLKSSFKLALGSFEEFIQDNKLMDDCQDSKSEGEFVLYPKNMGPGEISARSLSDILESLQSTINSMINRVMGNVNEVGRYPQNVVQDSMLTINAISEGSFRLGISFDQQRQANMFGETANEKQINLLSQVFDTIKKNNVVEVINEYDYRTYKNFKDLFNTLNKYSTSFALNNYTVKKEIYFDLDETTKIHNEFAKQMEVIEKNVTITGRMSKIDTERSKIQVQDKTSGEFVNFDISDDLFKTAVLSTNCNYEIKAKKSIYKIAKEHPSAIKYVVANFNDIILKE